MNQDLSSAIAIQRLEFRITSTIHADRATNKSHKEETMLKILTCTLAALAMLIWQARPAKADFKGILVYRANAIRCEEN